MSSEIEYITSAEDAEENAAEKMRVMGFTDAQVTGPGPDGGIDVWSRKAVAQVKWRSAQTGRPELQRLYGARGDNHHQKLLFFTASGYSQAAIEYAKSVKIALFTYDPLGELTPHNKRARKLLTNPEESEETPDPIPAGIPFNPKIHSKPPKTSGGGGGVFIETVGGLIALTLVWNLLEMLFAPESRTEFVIALSVVIVAVALVLVFFWFRRWAAKKRWIELERERQAIESGEGTSDA